MSPNENNVRELPQIPEVLKFIAAQQRFNRAVRRGNADAALEHLSQMNIEFHKINKKLKGIAI